MRLLFGCLLLVLVVAWTVEANLSAEHVARNRALKRVRAEGRFKAKIKHQVKGTAPSDDWATNGRPVYLLGFPGDKNLGVMAELARAGHVMVADGTVEEILAGTRHAWGYHPPEGWCARMMNFFHVSLLSCIGTSTAGIVQDDSHWVIKLAGTTANQGWPFCWADVSNTCGEHCRKAMIADYDNSQKFWSNKVWGSGAYGNLWSYAFSINSGVCTATNGNIGTDGGLFTASLSQLTTWAGHRVNNVWDKDGKYKMCANCLFWPVMAGITNLFDDQEVRKGHMSTWFRAAYALNGNGFTCKCFVAKPSTKKKCEIDDKEFTDESSPCTRFERCFKENKKAEKQSCDESCDVKDVKKCTDDSCEAKMKKAVENDQ